MATAPIIKYVLEPPPDGKPPPNKLGKFAKGSII